MKVKGDDLSFDPIRLQYHNDTILVKTPQLHVLCGCDTLVANTGNWIFCVEVVRL